LKLCRNQVERRSKEASYTRWRPVEESRKKMTRQGRHVVEGSYEKEASRRDHKEDCLDIEWAMGIL